MATASTSLSKIKANSLNLAGTFGFTGTVSGLADETPLVLISTFTSDGSNATASFTSGIDSTYKEYIFKFINMHPSSNAGSNTFQFNMSADSGSNYNVTKTSTHFRALHNEDDSAASIGYETAHDLAQGTGFQDISINVGGDDDECVSGTLHLFEPSSTTFVKHFIARSAPYEYSNRAFDCFAAGYGNTTSAVDAVQFKFSQNNMATGTIKMYGVV